MTEYLLKDKRISLSNHSLQLLEVNTFCIALKTFEKEHIRDILYLR